MASNLRSRTPTRSNSFAPVHVNITLDSLLGAPKMKIDSCPPLLPQDPGDEPCETSIAMLSVATKAKGTHPNENQPAMATLNFSPIGTRTTNSSPIKRSNHLNISSNNSILEQLLLDGGNPCDSSLAGKEISCYPS